MQALENMKTFVGRDAESAAITTAIDGLLEGGGGVLFIAGEPGIGKTTLARLAAAQAETRGAAVYWGFSWEAGGAPAYWPWTQLLRSLLNDSGVDPASRSSLEPVLSAASAASGTRTDVDPNQARFRLLESVRALLDSSSGTNPLLLILEDLHAADSDSLHLLHHIAHHVASMPVLVIGTFREAEAKTSRAVEPLWRTTKDAAVLRPQRLGKKDVREFVLGEGHEPDDQLVQILVDTSSGNPLFLTELFRVVQSDNAGVDLPESIQQVIRQQIAPLPERTARLLRRAAVLGRLFRLTDLASLTNESSIAIAEQLKPATDAGIVDELPAGRMRFSHSLHRDVLYYDTGVTDRSLLHVRYADDLKSRIADGDEDLWSELAAHLAAAGEDHRSDTINAWRNAARRARDRLAFDDAATLFNKAIEALGEGPRFDPADRAQLMLECGEAMLLAGDIDGGRKYCNDTFSLAQTLDDPQLMAEAALSSGSAIVVASIDKNLIGMLRECLDALPDDDAATRARVLARLAAALQPAIDPTGPMDMAREAIALARSTGDSKVVYSVLRSAISALMDFAPSDERIALNREFGELAAGFGDVPGRFRSNLRLMIDASEIGDQAMMAAAIDACDRIAARIDLPHYRWRAASARAMQAMLEGQYPDAVRLLDRAQEQAEIAGEMEAAVTLPLQRFGILCEWDSPAATPMAEIEKQLQYAFDHGMAEAEFFIRPLLAVFTVDSAEIARRLLANQAMIERAFKGGDRFSVYAMGLLAIKASDAALAQKVYDALLGYRHECASVGLMGSTWNGPVALGLGRLAHYLGDNDAACAHLEEALGIAKRMRSRPYLARIEALLADVHADLGNADRSRQFAESARATMMELSMRPAAFVPADDVQEPAAQQATISIELIGDIYEVRFGAQSATLKASKGLAMLARLTSEPDRDLHVLDLSGSGEPADPGDSGPLLDRQARAQYESRVRELSEELEEATELSDHGRTDALREELEFITRELSRAFGLGGRNRRASNAAEKARVNVRRRVKDAIERIGQLIPGAGRYLENTIKTGTYCRYSPM